MATMREASGAFGGALRAHIRRQLVPSGTRRCASSQAAGAQASAVERELLDLETDSSMSAPQPGREEVKKYYPLRRAYERKTRLPPSRYQYHPPKYNRGPLHPIQSPPASDPIARDFVPGPFNLPRLKQTYQSTVASDIMTLTYMHKPPGTEEKVVGDRLRGWDGSSPYHKNRPLRGPRGSPNLLPVEKDITFRNIPEIKEITVASYVPKAIKESWHLLTARSLLLAITGVLPEITKTRSSVVQWGIKEGQPAGVKVTLHGNEAYEFLDKCIHLVFPRIKDWKGVQASTGDSTGNLAWGFNPEDVQLFPEVESNFDAYHTKMIPGCRVFVKTTAKSDRHARLLLQSLGLPFHGKVRN